MVGPMKIRFMIWLYAKASAVCRNVGSREVQCPGCDEKYEIMDLFQADCGHTVCLSCYVAGEDCTLCEQCDAPEIDS